MMNQELWSSAAEIKRFRLWLQEVYEKYFNYFKENAANMNKAEADRWVDMLAYYNILIDDLNDAAEATSFVAF